MVSRSSFPPVKRGRDEKLARQLTNERRRKTRMDGGIGGWVTATTWSAWELLQLGCPPDETGLSRMIGYILAQQDKPGRFGEGCSERRHAIGHCQHYMAGFFSPGPIDHAIAPLAFPSGAVITQEWDARFSASCFALRTVLQARQDRRESVVRHLHSLMHLSDRWMNDEFPATTDTAFTALAAIAVAPLGYREHANKIAERLLAVQRPDGTWENASPYHAMDALLTLSTPAVKRGIERATQHMIATQHPDGSFGEMGNEEIALICLRAIRSLGARQVKPRPPRISPAPIPLRSR